MLLLSNFGGGTNLLLRMALLISRSLGGICLIEHFDSEIYYDYLDKVWELLGILAKKE
jgi:hypothetical protein